MNDQDTNRILEAENKSFKLTAALPNIAIWITLFLVALITLKVFKLL